MTKTECYVRTALAHFIEDHFNDDVTPRGRERFLDRRFDGSPVNDNGGHAFNVALDRALAGVLKRLRR